MSIMLLPKVSIITATFNSEKTLEDTINSVLNQEYKNIEYLLIDGGSTDNTIEIIKRYNHFFGGRLRWISENDRGIYDAWNKGLKLSTGEWICFVGGDDILLENAISKYIEALNNNPGSNFISSNILLVKENLDPIRLIGNPWSNKMRSYNCIAHVGSLHHKSLFHQKGTFNADYRIVGDYDFFLRCSDIITPLYLPILTAKVREAGISGKHIFQVAKEVLKTKMRNKIKAPFLCYLDYVKMIFKHIIRQNIINKFPTSTFLEKNDIKKS